MAKKIEPKHQFTKDEIRQVMKLWMSKTSAELCEDLDINYGQLQYIVAKIRNAGFDLPKKRKIHIVDGLIKEVMAELE